MLIDCIVNLVTTVKIGVMALANKVPGFHYPRVNWTRRGYCFEKTTKMMQTITFNLLKESKLYKHLLNGRFTSKGMIVVVSVHQKHLNVSLFRPVKRDNQSGLRSVLPSGDFLQEDFEFVLKDGRLIKPVSNTQGSWIRAIGYFPEDPVACFKVPLAERSRVEILEYVFKDIIVQPDRMIKLDPIEVVDTSPTTRQKEELNKEIYTHYKDKSQPV